MQVQSLTIGMVGSGGDGVVTSGDMLLSAVAAEGLYALSGKSFGPQIRGGESSVRVRIATQAVENTGSGLDYLIVLNWRDYGRFSGELNIARDGIIICEAEDPATRDGSMAALAGHAHVIPLAFEKMAETAGGRRAKNVLTLGLLCGLTNLPRERFLMALDRKFAAKGEAILQTNRQAFLAGWQCAQEIKQPHWPTLAYQTATPKMLLDGNSAIAAAAVAAGVQFFAGYPITPSTEIMQWLTRHLPEFGGTVVQAEDEISAMAMVCGASFAGARAMTTTSGPGMSLKTELIGMASMAELPCVIVNVQRGGPSTGVPTKGEQADLYQALFSAHGDAPRPVLAPYDAISAVQVTFAAFDLAETFQTPVVILSDGFLAQSKQVCAVPQLSDRERFPVSYRKTPTAEALAAGYKRFAATPDHISPMAVPGQPGGNYLASGIEHNAAGHPISDAKGHESMNHKRIAKLEPIRQRADLVRFFGEPQARDACIAWGASVGAAKEAVEILRSQGRDVKLIVPLLLAPLPVEVLSGALRGVQRLAVIELNYQAQLARYLRMELNLPEVVHHINRSGGAVWQPEELAARLGAVFTNGASAAAPASACNSDSGPQPLVGVA